MICMLGARYWVRGKRLSMSWYPETRARPLFVIGRYRGVGREDGHGFHRDAATGYVAEARVGFVVEVLGKVFGGRVELGEGAEIVDHLVIEVVDHVLHDELEVLEVEEQAGVIKFAPGERHPDLVIMSVRVLALSLVIAQVMTCGKTVFYCDFVHYASVDIVQKTDSPQRHRDTEKLWLKIPKL